MPPTPMVKLYTKRASGNLLGVRGQKTRLKNPSVGDHMSPWILLLTPLFLLACAGYQPRERVSTATAAPIVLPDGSKGFSIRCDNEGMNACYELVGQVCQHGYTVQMQNNQAGYVSEHESAISAIPEKLAGGSYGYTKSTSDNGLIVACKDPDEMERLWVDGMRQQKERQNNEFAQRQKEAQSNLIALEVVLGVLALVTIIVLANN